MLITLLAELKLHCSTENKTEMRKFCNHRIKRNAKTCLCSLAVFTEMPKNCMKIHQ